MQRRGRPLTRAGLCIVGLVALCALVGAPAAAADVGAERELAEKYAPVVRLVEQAQECGAGEPFEPIDVDLLFGNREVAFRGPWTENDLVKIGPEATDLVGAFEHHLDFPGDALDPGCTYEEWSRRLTPGHTPTVYAHVASQEDTPGKLALQYWFYYVFNDFNNKHEGDWEMTQLVFDAGTPEEALQQEPTEVGYSSHEGAERAAWGDEKLELVEDTHPVVYPAAGSHANKYTPALYIGSSAEAGVGCDDTRGPHRELRPAIVTIPSDSAAASESFPWIGFEGRWGERQKAFFNGPTGPNLKTQWTEPITWAEGWRDRSYAVPTSGPFGTGATDLFCSGVERGSAALLRLLRNPVPTLIILGGLAALIVWLIVRATWTPTAPFRLGRRRTWGQTVSASARMYVERPLLVLGMGAVFLPLAFVITFVQWLLVKAIDAVAVLTGQGAGLVAYLALVVGTTLTLFGLALVQAATAGALRELDEGRSVGPIGAYRLALRRGRPLLGATAIVVVASVVLGTTVLLIPVAIWVAVRWSLLAPVIEYESARPLRSLRRSGELVRGRWLRTASLVGTSALFTLVAGPLLGALLIFVSNSALALVNLVAGVVYALVLPFVALVTTYVYSDARTHVELEPAEKIDELPAEIAFSASSPARGTAS
jgi:hypothetical protein